MRAWNVVTAVCFAAVGVVLCGCGQKKIAECNALVQVINASVTGIEKAAKTDGEQSSTAELKAMADALDRIATSASGVELSLRDVRKFRDDYQKMVKEIAKAERELAEAADSRDPTKRAAANTALDAAVKQEDPLVEQINKYCQAP